MNKFDDDKLANKKSESLLGDEFINRMQVDFRKLVEEFQNRTIYKELSVKILETIPDHKIDQAILDYIDTKVVDFKKKFDIVSNMSEEFQMVYSTVTLEGQVNNGGFNQFFFNSSGQYAEMALRSLELLGATEYYDILQKAIEIHLQEKNNPILQNLYSQGTLEAFSASYEITALEECDTEFYELKGRLTELRLKFIRSYPHLFVGS